MSKKDSIDRRIRRVVNRANKRFEAAMWRGIKSVEVEMAALQAAKTEIMRLRSRQRRSR